MPAAKPVSDTDVPDGAATCTNVEHPRTGHRCTRYPVTPTLSVDADHDRFTCDTDTAAADNPAGTDGATVSGPGGDPNAVVITVCSSATLNARL